MLYLLLKSYLNDKYKKVLINLFAATAVSFYYWYRLPSLFGFGKFEADGLLVNLKNVIPGWTITLAAACLVLFFFYRILIRGTKLKSWIIRPAFAARESGA